MRDDDGRAEYHYVLIDYFCKVTGGSLRRATIAATSVGFESRTCRACC